MNEINTKLEELEFNKDRFERNIINTLKGRNYFAAFDQKTISKLDSLIDLSDDNLNIEFRFNAFFNNFKDFLIQSGWKKNVDETIQWWQTKEVVINSLLLEIFFRMDKNLLSRIFSSLFSFDISDEQLAVVKLKTFDPKDQYSLALDLILEGTSNLFLIELKCGSSYPVEQYAKSLRIYNAFKKKQTYKIKYLLFTNKGYEDIGVLTWGSKWATGCSDRDRCRFIDPIEYKRIMEGYKKKDKWKKYVSSEEFNSHIELPIYFRSYKEILSAFNNVVSFGAESNYTLSTIKKNLEFTINLLKH